MQYTFHPDMGEDELISTLRELYQENPGINITRIRFRGLTDISDATWSRYFGTFQEFKRAAGVDLNRHQHKIERNIAQHRVDHYRQFNLERRDLGDRYNKPHGNKIKTILLF